MTFLPLQTVSERASELIATAERAIASKADKLAPGLKEQYDAQLALYKSPNVPSVEIIVFPFNPHPTGSFLSFSMLVSFRYVLMTGANTIRPSRSAHRRLPRPQPPVLARVHRASSPPHLLTCRADQMPALQHATTADPAVEPAIDPNYLGEEVDFEILVDTAKFILKVAGTAPWQDVAERELFPGAAGATEEGLRGACIRI